MKQGLRPEDSGFAAGEGNENEMCVAIEQRMLGLKLRREVVLTSGGDPRVYPTNVCTHRHVHPAALVIISKYKTSVLFLLWITRMFYIYIYIHIYM